MILLTLALLLKASGLLLLIVLMAAIILGHDRRVGLGTNFIMILVKFITIIRQDHTSLRRAGGLNFVNRLSEKPTLHHTELIQIPSAHGNHSIPVTLYYPAGWDGSSLLPLVVYSHGGGFIRGTVLEYAVLTSHLASSTKSLFASIEYRLAPENPFPAAPNDCLDAARHLISHGSRYHIDSTRVALMGDSAGGNLATVTAIELAALKIPVLAQILVYPCTDIFAPVNRFYRSWVEESTALLPSDRMIFFTRNYLPNWRAGFDYRASPLLATDEQLRNVAPMYLLAAEVDCLRDEGRAYYERLKALGVKSSYQVFKRSTHGCMSVPLMDGCRESRRAAVDILRSVFQT